MLRTQQTLNRLVRICQQAAASQRVQRPSLVKPSRTRALQPITQRWFSSAINSQSASTIEADADAAVAKERKLKILQMEASVLRQEGRRVPDPDRMKPDQWEHLLSLDSKSARSKFYGFLWSVEMKRESERVIIVN